MEKLRSISIGKLYGLFSAAILGLFVIAVSIVTVSLRNDLQKTASRQQAQIILRSLDATLHNDLLSSNLLLAADKAKEVIGRDSSNYFGIRLVDEQGIERLKIDPADIAARPGAEVVHSTIYYDTEKKNPAYSLYVSFLPQTLLIQDLFRTIALALVIIGLAVFGMTSIIGFTRILFRRALDAISRGDVNPILFGSLEVKELRTLKSTFYELNEKRQALIEARVQAESAGKLSQMAEQVAHDIRSPLSALDMVLRDLSQLPEEKRLLVRASIGRIRDIANNLLQQKKKALATGGDATLSHAQESNGITLQLVPALIDGLITEKRMQFRAQIGVEIDFDLTDSSYGIFVALDAVEFKRVLSNLINNAVEAIGDRGRVSIALKRNGNDAILNVIDTGPGISPEILSKLGQRGETHGKQGGSGLGLYHARASIESWGGRFEITSQVGVGTTIRLSLPTCKPPGWFVEKIHVEAGLQIVVLDDDTSIHQIWKERFEPFTASSALEVKLVHLATPQQLRDFAATLAKDNAATLFLMDYELLGFKETGLDLVNELEIKNRCILVTSRFEEPGIRKRCEEMGLTLVPKGMAGFVPIEASAAKKLPSTVVDVILIDDDPLVHATWRMAAKEAVKRVALFSEPEEFFGCAADFGVEVPVYVDVSLARGVRGEEIAKRIFDLGFANIYLATGYGADQVKSLPFLKGIVGKEPPFN